MKPYYEQDGITIYHGDCLSVMRALEPVDLILTDPPYGVGKAEWDDYFPTDWMQFAARLAPTIGLMPGVWNLARCPERIGALQYRWTLAAHLVNGMTRGAIGFGNWIPCLVYATEAVRLHRDESDIRRVVVGADDKPDHPSPKPYTACRWFLNRLPGDTVLDPFMGSGTTLRAAKDLGRNAIGIEIEERYCEIAAKRLAQGALPLEMGA